MANAIHVWVKRIEGGLIYVFTHRVIHANAQLFVKALIDFFEVVFKSLYFFVFEFIHKSTFFHGELSFLDLWLLRQLISIYIIVWCSAKFRRFVWKLENVFCFWRILVNGAYAIFDIKLFLIFIIYCIQHGRSRNLPCFLLTWRTSWTWYELGGPWRSLRLWLEVFKVLNCISPIFAYLRGLAH